MEKNYFYSKNILTSGGYIKVNLYLMKNLGIEEAILIEFFASQKNYFKEKGTLGKDEYFYTTYDYLSEYTGIKKFQVVGAVKHLEKLHIISTKLSVVDGKKTKWYKLNHKKLDQYYTQEESTVSEHTEGEQSYILYNRKLATLISPQAAIIFDDLMTSYTCACEWNTLIDDKYFVRGQAELAKKCQMTKQTMCNVHFPALKEIGLIEVKPIGWPKTSGVWINFQRFFELMGVKEEDGYKTVTSVSEAEKVTKALIQKAKEFGVEWTFSHRLTSYVEERLEEGYTEKDFFNVLEHMYNYYTEKEKVEKMFTFENLYTSSKMKQWLKKVSQDGKKENASSEAQKALKAIIEKAKELTGKEWTNTPEKERTIRQLLEQGIKEEEMINLLGERYDFLNRAGYSLKSFNFSKIFGESCFGSIQAQRRKAQDTYKSTPQKGGREVGNGNSRDSARSISLTEEERSRAVEMAELYEASGEIGYF